MERRRFLRQLGLGSFGAVSLPALTTIPAIPVSGAERRNFHLLAVSAAGTQGGLRAPRNQMFMSGDGAFTPGGSDVLGGGFYVHFLFPGRIPLPGELALPVVASGTWKARRVVRYKEIGMWGMEAGGSLELVIDLFRQAPSRTTIRGARLEVVSNPPFAGLVADDPRIGYTLSVPDTDFTQGGRVGPFSPLDPPFGIAAFSAAALT